jgi:membrane protein DedA with SNARE-associated domain
MAQTQGTGAYALVFGILVACGLGVPLPEDIALILGGVLAYQQAVHLPLMALVGFAGILAGDSLIYLAGRRIGVGAMQGPLKHVVTADKRDRVEQLFRKHGQKVIMIARFFPGVRAVTYFIAGSARMRYWRFISFDGMAALLSAPAFVYLGYRLGGRLEWLIHRLRHGQLALVLTAAVALGAYLLIRHRRRGTPSGPVASPARTDA